jgi:hypothetical protein
MLQPYVTACGQYREKGSHRREFQMPPRLIHHALWDKFSLGTLPPFREYGCLIITVSLFGDSPRGRNSGLIFPTQVDEPQFGLWFTRVHNLQNGLWERRLVHLWDEIMEQGQIVASQ